MSNRYAPDLMKDLSELDETQLGKKMQDPQFLARALKCESPPMLVAMAADKFDRDQLIGKLAATVDMCQDRPISTLSAYERARIALILGEKELARNLLVELLGLLESSGQGDPVLEGYILTDMAKVEPDLKVALGHLQRAIQEKGHKNGLVDMGLFLYYRAGKQDQAIDLLLQGMREGVIDCAGVLGHIIASEATSGKVVKQFDISTRFDEIAAALEQGFQSADYEVMEKSFLELHARTVPRSRGGKVINTCQLHKNLRAIMESTRIVLAGG